MSTPAARFTIVQDEPAPLRHMFQVNWNNKLDGRAFMDLVPSNSLRWKQGRLYECAWSTIRELGVFRLVELKVVTLEQVNDFIAYACFGRPAREARQIMERQHPGMFMDFAERTPLMLLLFAWERDGENMLIEQPDDHPSFRLQGTLVNLNEPLCTPVYPKEPQGESTGFQTTMFDFTRTRP